MNETLDTHLLRRVRSHYGGGVNSPDMSSIRMRARRLERRRRRAGTALVAAVALCGSVLAFVVLSRDADDGGRVSTAAGLSSVGDSTFIDDVGAVVRVAPPGATKGPVPNDAVLPNGGIDKSKAPMYVAVAGADAEAPVGYVYIDDILPPEPGLRSEPLTDRPKAVYDSTLTRVIGHMFSGKGFVPVGTDAASVPTLPTRSIEQSPTTTTRSPIATTVRPNNQVVVLVANGSDRTGYATNVERGLKSLGYTTLAPENARQLQAATVIYFRETYAEDAKRLANTMGATADIVQPMPNSLTDRLEDPVVQRAKDANIIVVLGNEATTYQPTSSTTSPSTIPVVRP